MRSGMRELILPKAPKPNKHSTVSLNKAHNHTTVDFLHHKNPPTWTGVESTTLGTQGQQQTNYATQPAYRKLSEPFLTMSMYDTVRHMYGSESVALRTPPHRRGEAGF
ncbi:hypothetical protein TNCV_3493591 [Trichonephila clavipes]|nr:hypothetical protein TNCV_3493591 [Trichonephila clavipes]